MIVPKWKRQKVVKIFANDEDRMKDAECDAKAVEVSVWQSDLHELFTLVKFGVEKIPSDLAVGDPEVNPKQLPGGRSRISDQDAMKDRLRMALEESGFVRGKKVPAQELFKIAKAIKLTGIENISTAATFSPGQPAYQLAYKYASELGYSRKKKG
jgi:hypothetical protein